MLFLNGWTEAARGNFISRIKSDVSWLCFWRSMVEFLLHNKRGEDWKKSVGNYSKHFWFDLVFFRFIIDDEKTIRWKTLENFLCVNVSSRRCLCDNVKWLVPVIILFYRKYVNNVQRQRKSQVCILCGPATPETRKLLLHITFLNTPHSPHSYVINVKKHFFCHPPPIILTTTWRSRNTNSFMESNIIALFYLSTSHTKELNINTFTRFSMNEKLSCLCVVYTQRHARMVENVIMWCLFVIRACTNRWVGDTGGGKYT